MPYELLLACANKDESATPIIALCLIVYVLCIITWPFFTNWFAGEFKYSIDKYKDSKEYEKNFYELDDKLRKRRESQLDLLILVSPIAYVFIGSYYFGKFLLGYVGYTVRTAFWKPTKIVKVEIPHQGPYR